ncbi:hypothetical protein CLV92_113106 [Kineococcus xinjiangensis]|uniref:Uncharacterized protein n=1 Tax=Kineococcus xinjiangensis TaxID=512762 RepID=A0A2S6IEQ3_9ACTN|nr:hypothetical protein [Kineococcus xinjiangensis]PPK92677.1 hypothetical protein CLV92_113106 [Kineococcus xinjiangensis]
MSTTTARRPRWTRLLAPAVLVAVALAGAILVSSLRGGWSWGNVASTALGFVTGGAVAVLVALVLLRLATARHRRRRIDAEQQRRDRAALDALEPLRDATGPREEPS